MTIIMPMRVKQEAASPNLAAVRKPTPTLKRLGATRTVSLNANFGCASNRGYAISKLESKYSPKVKMKPMRNSETSSEISWMKTLRSEGFCGTWLVSSVKESEGL